MLDYPAPALAPDLNDALLGLEARPGMAAITVGLPPVPAAATQYGL